MPVQIGPERSRMISVGAVGSDRRGGCSPRPWLLIERWVMSTVQRLTQHCGEYVVEPQPANSECLARGCHPNPRSKEHVLG
jgi:hypothetical protein